MNAAIIIPSRYGSTRFPGKPLAQIAGKSMLLRVCEIAAQAAKIAGNTEILIATEDERILQHAEEIGYKAVLTSDTCRTGSDRVLEAAAHLQNKPDFVINLQGDAPLTPPDFVAGLLTAFQKEPELDVVTPVTQLNWDELDKLRTAKQTTPFSGTTAILNRDNDAIWFSKNIIPAIRNEAALRDTETLSPVYRHIGIYGFKFSMLEKFVTLAQGAYEKLEGLEQLRILEHGYRIRAVPVSYNGLPSMSGVDSQEDVARAEALLAQYAERMAS